MKRNKRIIAVGAMLLLLIALCVPVLSGALAEGTSLEIPIHQATDLFNAKGEWIGTLDQGANNDVILTLKSKAAFAGLKVVYDPSAANETTNAKALVGKSHVEIIATSVASTPEVTPDPNAAPMPTEGWIDTNLIVAAYTVQHSVDVEAIAQRDATILQLQPKESMAPAPETPSPEPTPTANPGIFSVERMDIWVPVAAIAIGLFALGLLAWIAISTATNAWDTESQTKLLGKMGEQIAAGLKSSGPLRVEQTAWPKEGHVRLGSDVVEQIASVAAQNSALLERVNTTAKDSEPPPPPPPIPEGEEADLLQLANRLAGRASAAEWHEIVKEAGLKAVLLQANPTEKGTFVVDESGYSIIACLMRSPDAEIGYVLPSYQDPNASERRWMEFYSVNENNSVRNYRVDALAVVHIERGTFFLPKSYGRLTRRQQQF